MRSLQPSARVITQLYREIAAKRPGLFTKVGMRTFVDPRLEGGKLSPRTTEDIVKVVEIENEEWLFYRLSRSMSA